MPTVNEIALQLIKEQGESSDQDEYVEVVEQWIKDALDEFASAAEWRLFKATQTLSLQDGVAIYDIPATVAEIRGMRFVASDESIEYIDPVRLYAVAEDLENEGKPQWWTHYDNLGTLDPNKYEIKFTPIPDDDYTVQYQAILHPSLDITTSPSTTVLPLHQEMLICIKHRVRAYMLAHDNDYDGHDRLLQLFYAKVEELKAKENAPKANNARLQVRDLSRAGDRRLARLDPDHF